MYLIYLHVRQALLVFMSLIAPVSFIGLSKITFAFLKFLFTLARASVL